MANNKTKTVALALTVLVAFLAGGWFFSALPRWSAGGGEVDSLYQRDGEAMGIFDNIPPEDLAAAEAVAAYSLGQELVLPEDRAAQAVRHDGAKLPSQIALTQLSDIAGVAPKEEGALPEKALERGEMKGAGVALDLTGAEVAAVPAQDIASLPDGQSKATLIAAPVTYFLIKNAQEYKAFKTRARGSYPEVNFGKQMLVVLESDSNLPDKVFEIDSAEVQDGKLLVTYRVNVFGLDDKINTHTALAVNKTDAPVELRQVL